MTILPLPYAQLTRLVTFMLLVILPWASVGDVRYFCIPLSLVANLVFFTVDECSSQMEAPFGDDSADIDLPKLLRRIDKHTAATLGMWLGSPVQVRCPTPPSSPHAPHRYPSSRSFDDRKRHHTLASP